MMNRKHRENRSYIHENGFDAKEKSRTVIIMVYNEMERPPKIKKEN